MHQTLGKHVTSNATEKLSNLYNKISQAYHRRPGDENFQVNLDGVKRTLAETRRSTQREFLCFKQSKSTNRGNIPGGSRSGHEKDGSHNRKDHRWKVRQITLFFPISLPTRLYSSLWATFRSHCFWYTLRYNCIIEECATGYELRTRCEMSFCHCFNAILRGWPLETIHVEPNLPYLVLAPQFSVSASDKRGCWSVKLRMWHMKIWCFLFKSAKMNRGPLFFKSTSATVPFCREEDGNIVRITGVNMCVGHLSETNSLEDGLW